MNATRLWSLWRGTVLSFALCFTQRGRQRFVEWVTGLSLNVEEHTITQSLVGLGRPDDWKALESFAEHGSWHPPAPHWALAWPIDRLPNRPWHGYSPSASFSTTSPSRSRVGAGTTWCCRPTARTWRTTPWRSGTSARGSVVAALDRRGGRVYAGREEAAAVREASMTEEEWLGCTGTEDTGEMEEYLRGKGSLRQLRLFACACCRRIEALVMDPRSLRALAVAEMYADGLAAGEELDAAWQAANQAAEDREDEAEEESDPRPYNAALAAHWSAIPATLDCDAVEFASHSAFYALRAIDSSAEPRRQGRCLCDILGRPPSLSRVDPGWLTLTVRRLAQAAYDDRILPSGELDPVRLAVLADALEEAGCTDPTILDHLREPGRNHVRGCWAVDALLGKS